MAETIQERIAHSPFRNIYWFARYLVDTDQYGSIGKQKESQMLSIVKLLETVLVQPISDSEKLTVAKATLNTEVLGLFKEESKLFSCGENFVDTVIKDWNTLNDVSVFCITMKYVVHPINQAISQVPSDDSEFSLKIAKTMLDSLGESNVGTVIKTWDNLGIKGCLDAERSIVVEEFSKLLENLKTVDIEHTELDDNLLLTAFVQEMERRLGQKRKSRGGGSLESSVDYIFKYYGFQSSPAPIHFDTNLEVDKWFKTRDGWFIGISLKRTLRERWKQVNVSSDTLSHYKIKALWNISVFDKDLSDEKITMGGSQRQYYYLLDNSKVYERCASHEGMRDYVRPMSGLINDIRREMGLSSS